MCNKNRRIRNLCFRDFISVVGKTCLSTRMAGKCMPGKNAKSRDKLNLDRTGICSRFLVKKCRQMAEPTRIKKKCVQKGPN